MHRKPTAKPAKVLPRTPEEQLLVSGLILYTVVKARMPDMDEEFTDDHLQWAQDMRRAMDQVETAVRTSGSMIESHSSPRPHYDNWIQTKNEVATFVRRVEDHQKVHEAMDGADAIWANALPEILPPALSQDVKMKAAPSLTASETHGMAKGDETEPTKLNDPPCSKCMAAAVPCKKFEAKACLRCRDKHLTCEFATKTRAGSKRSEVASTSKTAKRSRQPSADADYSDGLGSTIMVRRPNKAVPAPRAKRVKGNEQEPRRIMVGELAQKLEAYKVELQSRKTVLLEAQRKITEQVEALMAQLKELINLQTQDEQRMDELLKMKAELEVQAMD